MARPMLLEVAEQAKTYLWAEAVKSANYIKNLIITKSLTEAKTQYENVHGKNQTYQTSVFFAAEHMHTFQAVNGPKSLMLEPWKV